MGNRHVQHGGWIWKARPTLGVMIGESVARGSGTPGSGGLGVLEGHGGSRGGASMAGSSVVVVVVDRFFLLGRQGGEEDRVPRSEGYDARMTISSGRW